MAKKQTHAVDAVIEAASGLADNAHDLVVPITKGAARELRKLEGKLGDARKTESKRFRQLAAAQASRGKKQVAKRTRQAGKAAADVARIAGRVAEIVGEAIGNATNTAVSAATDIGEASVRAAEAVSPVKAPAIPSVATPAPTRARTARPAAAKASSTRPAASRSSTTSAAAKPKPAAAKPKPTTTSRSTSRARPTRKPTTGA